MNSNAKRNGTEEEDALNSNTTSSLEVKIASLRQHKGLNSKSTRIFTIIILLLIVSCAVLIALYTMERTRRRKAETKNFQLNHQAQSKEVCTSKHCVRTAAAIHATLDESVNPCDDFYLFSCGGWKREHPIPEDEPYWTQVIELMEKNFKTLKRLIESETTREKYKENAALRKVFAYYDACKDTHAINLAGLSPLKNLIQNYGSWNITESGWTENWNLARQLGAIQRELKIYPLVSIRVIPDYRNSSVNRIMIDQTSHYITRESYLSTSLYNTKVRHAYIQLMIDVARMLGAKRGDATPQLQELFQFEQEMAKISVPKSDRVDKSRLSSVMTIEELTKQTGNQLDWFSLLKSLFEGSKYKISKDEKVIVFSIDFMKKLVNLTAHTPQRVLRNYVMWQAVVRLLPFLGPRFHWPYRDFNMVVSGSSGISSSMSQKCLHEMSSRRNELSYPLGVLFIDERFQRESKDKVIELINVLRDSFIANIQELDWMDEETKERATEKALAIRQNIGYPDYLEDPKELERQFKKLHIRNDSYFQSILNLRKFSVADNLDRLRVPVDKTRWIVPPQTVNAFYDRVTNKITFPAGILQEPFFDLSFPRVVSYGAIGIVVAHEITHGFDSNGRKYDKMGDLSNWWTNSSNEAFVRKAECFVEQYSKEKAYGTYLNGKQTLAENIADNGAIKQAFKAYKSWTNKQGEEPTLPGLNYTNDQLFFISAAQIDCGSIRPQTARKKIEVGTHTLDNWRVVIEMSNSREFATAFKCPVGSRMNPEKKCEVW